MPASDGAGTGPKRTQFAASDGEYRLERSWSHPNGPMSFNPAGGSKVTVAKLPAPRGHHGAPARYLVHSGLYSVRSHAWRERWAFGSAFHVGHSYLLIACV